jgi:hypothetical protein
MGGRNRQRAEATAGAARRSRHRTGREALTAARHIQSPELTGRERAISWTPIWDKDRNRTGLEHLLLRDGSADSVVLAFDEHGRPFRLAYQLSWDEAWRLRDARLVVTTEGSSRSLHLGTDGNGHWRHGDARTLPELDGCIDVDVWPTPFTNTFPIRRQPLAVGERREFVVAWVSAPELTFRRTRQGYTRLADRLYQFESLDGSGFRAQLPVDEDGVVLDYEGVFRRIAT